MNRPTVLRNSAEPEIVIGIALKIFYDVNDWLDNSSFMDYLDIEYDRINRERELRTGGQGIAKYKPALYYGLLDVRGDGAHRINESGRRFYEAYKSGNEEEMVDCLIKSLSTCIFGRNNNAVAESNSLIDPPKVFLLSCLLLNNKLHKNEYAYILENLTNGKDYTRILVEVSLSRIKQLELMISDYSKNNYRDDKGIKFLSDSGLLQNIDKGTKSIKEKYIIKYSNVLTSLSLISDKKNVNDIHFTQENVQKSEVYMNYLSAIKTKPFLILGGFSGTGKSQKVKELAFLTCPNDESMASKLGNTDNTPGNYCLVSVRPNWHDSSDLLGYYSSINDRYIITDFVRFLVKAMHFPDIPFFVCLDEMNLAPVEEYFAEYLSVLESRKKVGNTICTDPLVSADWFKKDYKGHNIFDDLGFDRIGKTQSKGENQQAGVFSMIDENPFERMDIIENLQNRGLCLPPNVVVIGTVNMDDTTNSFSRKVIDRAMTFETVIDEFGPDYYNSIDTLSYNGSAKGQWVGILPDEVKATEAINNQPELLNDNEKNEITNYVNDVNKCLSGSPFQISYRIINETILYYRSMKFFDKNASLNQVFDDILMQKVLPRIEGDYDKTFNYLNNLKTMAETRSWVKSKNKIDFMLGRFRKDDQGGFTNFWC